MLTRKMLLTMYDYNFYLVSQGIEDLDHQQSLISPSGGANPANWILGHIITSRSNVLAMLKADPPWDFKHCQPYLPDSEPLAKGDKIEDFEEMKKVFQQTQVILLPIIREIREEDLQESSPDKPLGEELAGYAIHEAYHAGELAIIKGIIRTL